MAAKVIRWQRVHGRHGLPWQGTRDPYAVWLSEVMLQQTQVSTVLGYYTRFLQRFPDVAALAAAPRDEVLALWSGLGYYSRARNLHACAQAVVAQHGGQFPRSALALALLPGIGRSTAAAIAAFCFGERVAILDANVKRVLSRVLAFGGDVTRAAATEALWAQAQALLPVRGMAVYTQGLMDLGATVCTARKPTCLLCPLAGDCQALAQGKPESYPVKGKKARRSQREHALLWLQHSGRVWLVQRPDKGVWAGLWTLPEYSGRPLLEDTVARWPGQGRWQPTIHHALTHFDWTLHVLHWALPRAAAEPAALPAGRWFTLDEALSAGLPAPIRKLLAA
ncbi:MAG: A/G-specific adenine glycosylase [Rubrivivax sp.]|nr:A/G-specific adenine glycosylase [Rubrivivax sp.]